MPEDTSSTSAPTEPTPPAPEAATGTPPGQQAGSADERKFSQADVDRIVKERIEREKAKADTAAQKAAREAEAKALADQGEFKKLAESRGQELAEANKRLEELDALKKDNARLSKALADQIAAQTKDLPDYLRELLASKDPVSQMDWLTANADKLKTPAAAAAPAPGINAGARGNGQGKLSDDEARDLAAVYNVRPEYIRK